MSIDPLLVRVARLLTAQRAVVITRWQEEVAAQPFHHGRRESAVSDDVPRLYDALVTCITRSSREPASADACDDPAVRAAAAARAVRAAAAARARTRADQGLQPEDMVVEFRLLRQEMHRALQADPPEALAPDAQRMAELLLTDSLDGVIAVGLGIYMEHVERLRAEFLATTVHDVRHPLTAVQGFAQLALRRLRHDPLDPAEQERLLETVLAEAGRLETLLHRLANAARAALGHLDLRQEPVDLADVTRSAIAALLPEEAACVVLAVPPEADAQVIGDAERLRQVLDNLLSNALKYAPAPTPVQIVMEPEGVSLHLRVADRGMGIAPDDIPLLFRRYRRTTTAQDAGIAGAGLGLYLCRAIVEQHGGRIWAASPGLGQGTTIHVLLPRQPQRDATGAATPAEETGSVADAAPA